MAVRWALEAQRLLAEDWGVARGAWSATSWTELRRDALACEEWNMLQPEAEPRVPYVTRALDGHPGPVVAVSDWIRAVPDQIARWVPAPYTSLGTDGWGFSDTRPAARRFFHVDAESITVAVLGQLAKLGEVKPEVVARPSRSTGWTCRSATPFLSRRRRAAAPRQRGWAPSAGRGAWWPAGAPRPGRAVRLGCARCGTAATRCCGAPGWCPTIGSWMQAVAVGALLISRTGQATWAVLVAAAAFLPIGLLSPVGGALADRVPRRPVLIAGNLAAAAVAVVLAVLVGAGHEDPALLVALVAVQGAASAVIGPFQQAILPDLVPKSEFLPAIALNSAQWNLGRIVGPARPARPSPRSATRRLRRQRGVVPGRRRGPGLRPAGPARRARRDSCWPRCGRGAPSARRRAVLLGRRLHHRRSSR